jgi:hypothetical protein
MFVQVVKDELSPGDAARAAEAELKRILEERKRVAG